MEKSYLYSIRVCLIFYTLMLALICAVPAIESTTEESATISIPRDHCVIFTDLFGKKVSKHQEETQAERLAKLEGKVTTYEKERKQILKYFDLLTEITKRMMQMEQETDSLKTSLREMKDNIVDVTNDLSNIKHDIREIQRNTIPEMKNETRNVKENIQYPNNSVQRIDEITHWYQENFTVEINHIKSYVEDKTESIFQQQKRDNTTIAKMFTDINWTMESLKQNYSVSMEQIKLDIQQAFEVEEQQHAEIKKNCLVAMSTYDTNFNKTLIKLKEEMTIVNENSNDANQIVKTLQNDMVSLTSKVRGVVGFTAKYRRTENNLMLFSSIVTNEGMGYSTTTGKFTCPVSGLYLFHLNIVTRTPGTATIMKNGVGIIRAYSGAKADDSDGVWDGDSTTVVLKLSKGDNVWVTNGGVSVDSDSNFSGALITVI